MFGSQKGLVTHGYSVYLPYGEAYHVLSFEQFLVENRI